jgi:nucleoside-diphosphate-sugar epimerase
VNVLLLGGTGFISGSLTQRLLERNDRVTILTRGRTTCEPDRRLERIIADRSVPSDLAHAIGARCFDVVYDMIAFRPEDSAETARLLRGRVGRFVHCSTISVYMVSDQIRCPVTEDQDSSPVMEFWDRNPFGMEYGILKRRCEGVLWNLHDERKFPVSVLRPTFVSGPADPAGRDFFWIERILDGGPLLVPGSGEFPFQQVYVEDVSRALVELPLTSRTIGRAYNIAGEEKFTLNEYLHSLGGILGRQPEMEHVEQSAFDGLPFSLSPAGDVFPFNTRRTAVFSLDAIQADIGYRSTPFADWMRTTIDWWQTTPHAHSNGYERRNDELAFIRSLRRS